MEVEITDEYIEDNLIIFDGVWCRNSNIPEISNKFELLKKTVFYLTNKPLNSSSLRCLGETLRYDSCICSCNKCHDIHLILDQETGVKFGVGSLCINKFNNKKLKIEHYYHTKAKRCSKCYNPLVKKENGYMLVNAENKGNICFECLKVYLNVSYEDKEDVKIRGAKWDADKKKWWVYRNNPNIKYLIKYY